MNLEEIKSDLKKLNILIVEDGKDIIEIMNRTFKLLVNNISLASNGDEALKLYKDEKPDLILTDLRMPHKDGIEFINEIRSFDKNSPIIVITAYEDDLSSDEKELVDAIFPKPINFLALVNKINSLV